MKRDRPRSRGWTRRAVLSSLAWPAFAQDVPGFRGQEFASDARRYPDPATEFEVVRMTDPAYASQLPASGSRCVSKKGDFLVYASARSGQMQLHRLEMKGYQTRQMTQAAALLVDSIGLMPDDKHATLVSDGVVRQISINNGKDQELAEVAPGSVVTAGPAVTEDGLYLFWSESSRNATSILRYRLPKGPPEKMADFKGKVQDLLPNPRRSTLLWVNEDGSMWVAAFDGTGMRQLQTPPGKVAQAHWSPDGRTVLYLHIPEDATRLNAIREQELDARTDRSVAQTSQFVRFARNANATVFLGASRSKASPNVLLLLRITRREFTLCEHRTSDPVRTSPRFSPNSQRIFFESDRDGKSALFTMPVEKLVEKTES